MTRVWLLAALLCAGCASFTDVPPVSAYSPHYGPERATARLVETHKYFIGDGRSSVESDFLSTVSSAVEAIRQRDWILLVKDSQSPQLSLDLTEYQSTGGNGLINLITGFVIPGVTDYHTDLELRLEDGTQPLTCKRSFDLRQWNEIFLVVVYPFAAPAYKRMRTSEALTLQCLAELLEERDARLRSH